MQLALYLSSKTSGMGLRSCVAKGEKDGHELHNRAQMSVRPVLGQA